MDKMTLYEDEVVLYRGIATSSEYKGCLNITLTSYKIVIEKEKGFLKKETKLIDSISLEDIKTYNGIIQIKQKGNSVEIQTISKNVILLFSGIVEARKFAGKTIDVATGTTLVKRGSEKVKNAFDMIDDTLGLDTRGTIRGILEQGLKGTIINGINKKKTEDKRMEDKS